MFDKPSEVGWAWGGSAPRSISDVDPESLYYFPKRRIRQVIQTMDLIRQNSLSAAEHDMLFIDQWKILITKVSVDFKYLSEDKWMARHYGVKCRIVSNGEMIRNILWAYREVNHHFPHMSFQRKIKMFHVMVIKINGIFKMILNSCYMRMKAYAKQIYACINMR